MVITCWKPNAHYKFNRQLTVNGEPSNSTEIVLMALYMAFNGELRPLTENLIIMHYELCIGNGAPLLRTSQKMRNFAAM